MESLSLMQYHARDGVEGQAKKKRFLSFLSSPAVVVRANLWPILCVESNTQAGEGRETRGEE